MRQLYGVVYGGRELSIPLLKRHIILFDKFFVLRLQTRVFASEASWPNIHLGIDEKQLQTELDYLRSVNIIKDGWPVDQSIEYTEDVSSPHVIGPSTGPALER